MPQFDPKVDDALKREFMDELHAMRYVLRGAAVLRPHVFTELSVCACVCVCVSMLHHPNVVKFLGACCKPPKLCFVMELLDQSLYELLHKSRKFYNYQDLVNMAVSVLILGSPKLLPRSI